MPTPNPNANRRARHYNWTHLSGEPMDREPPPLTAEHSDRARALWESWWRLPVSAIWDEEADASALERLLDLYEASWGEDGLNASLHAELRRMEESYGLSPAGRRKLHVLIEGLDTEPSDPSQVEDVSTRPKRSGPGEDPRKLRVV